MDARLFRGFRGAGTSKTGAIKKWKKTFGEYVSGHSPWRSGAVFYMRQGLPIKEPAFLGRWKSSVVLQYTGEALEEKAVEILQSTGHSNVSIRTTNVPVETESILVKENKFQASPETINERDQIISHAFDKPKVLWVHKRTRLEKSSQTSSYQSSLDSTHQILDHRLWLAVCQPSLRILFSHRFVGGQGEVQQM